MTDTDTVADEVAAPALCPITGEPAMLTRRFCQVLCGVEDVVLRLHEIITGTTDETVVAEMVTALDGIRADIAARFGADAFDLVSGDAPGTLQVLEAPEAPRALLDAPEAPAALEVEEAPVVEAPAACTAPAVPEVPAAPEAPVAKETSKASSFGGRRRNR